MKTTTLLITVLILVLFTGCTNESANSFTVMNDSIMSALRDTAFNSFMGSVPNINKCNIKIVKELSSDSLITFTDSGSYDVGTNYYIQEHLNIAKSSSLFGNRRYITGWGVDTLRIWSGSLLVFLVENNFQRDLYGVHPELDYPVGAKATINEECISTNSEEDLDRLDGISSTSFKLMIYDKKLSILKAGESGKIVDYDNGKICLEIDYIKRWTYAKYVNVEFTKAN